MQRSALEDAQEGIALLRTEAASEEAEQALLGAVLIDNRALDVVGDKLSPAHFHIPVHGRIYQACRDLRDAGKGADPVTLWDQFRDDADLKNSGGAEYLADLAVGLVSVANATDYADSIIDLSRRREALHALACALPDLITTGHKEARSSLINELDAADSDKRAAVTISDVLKDLSNRIALVATGEAPAPIRTGLHDLDRKLGGGFSGSDLVIVAGRPSMGKTTLAECIARNVARDGKRVLFFSLEMAREQLAAKEMQRQTGIEAIRQINGPLTDDEWRKLSVAIAGHNESRLVIDDDSGLKPSDIRRRAQRMQRSQGLDLVIVDYLNLMRPDDKASGIYERISSTVRDMQAVAKALGAPLVLLSQLSRALTNRDDKRPTLADLRDSGAIEEVANTILFVHREEYYLSRQPVHVMEGPELADWQDAMSKAKGKAEIIIAKQRMGPAPETEEVAFDGARQMFTSLARERV